MERQGLAPQPRDEARENELVQQCWSEELNVSRADISNKTLKDVRQQLSQDEQGKISRCIAKKIGES